MKKNNLCLILRHLLILIEKIPNAMKLTFLFLVISLLTFTAEASAQRVSISLNNVKVEKILSTITKQTGLSVAYSKQIVNLDRRMSIQVEDADVAQVLEKLVADTNLSYEIRNNKIFLFEKQTVASTPAVMQQKKRISGIVTELNGEPIIGANIVEKGTTNGTVTDLNGVYALQINTNATLIVSYIGYNTQEIKTGSNSTINIKLSEDSQSLEEVVIVGYGTQKKINLAGAVETVNTKSLADRATNNIGMALQGLVPNLNITTSGGAADDVPNFNIRGVASINEGGNPLILVDGVPASTEDFSRMNPSDIENISILKDASSAAIYGARAAFGVILATTKKGDGDKLTVNFNNDISIRSLTRLPQIVYDPYIQASYKKEMGKPWYDLYTDEELKYAQKRRDDPSLPDAIINSINPNSYTYLANTNWYDEIFDKTGLTHKHNLSISGANKKVSYYLGADFYQEKGLLKLNKDVYDRYNARSRVEYKPTSWLTVGNNTALTYFTYNKPTNFDDWLFEAVIHTDALSPVYNPDGSYTSDGATLVGALKEGGESKLSHSTVSTQFSANVELIKKIWNIKTDFTAIFTNEKLNEWKSDKAIPYRTGPNEVDYYLGWTNYAYVRDFKKNYTLFNLYTDFNKTFGEHTVSAVAGFSQEYETYEYFKGQRNDLITDSYPTLELATGEMTLNQTRNSLALRSAFYRLNYIWKDRYIFETNGRYDGTSRFPKNSRFGFFPSVSGAWIVSQEPFFAPAHTWFSHLKMRMSYGSLGNQNVSGYYPYLATMSAKKVDYLLNGDKPMGVYSPDLVSAGLTWEKVYTINAGIDANFLNNRLAITADVYRRDTKDMLTVGKTLPNVLGTSEPDINAANLKTRGWELSVTWRDQFNLKGKPFNYSVRGMLYDSRSFITKFDNPTGYLDDYYVGCELGEIWGLETLGFFKDQEDIDNSPSQWDVTSYPGDRPIEPGDLKYKDQNGDDKIDKGSWTLDDPGDYKVIGNTSPRYNYSMDLSASWNGFDLRMLFTGVGKRDFYFNNYKMFGIYVGPWGNVMQNNLDHWTPENTDAYFPRLKSYLAWGEGDLSENQTRYLQNAAFFRMKNLTFGYTIPTHLTAPLGVSKVRFYFSGENLFEFTKLCKSFDPEVISASAHPFQRTYSFGLNIVL